MARDGQAPLIVKKVVEEGGHGHHGGAWKVAYADFVTAMMAFFLLLWLLSTANKETLQGLAEYFSEARVNTGKPGGVGGVLEGVTVTPFEPVQPQTTTPFSFQVAVPMREEESAADFELDLSGREEGVDPVDAEALSDAELEAERERREQRRFEQAKAAIEQALESSPELSRYKENLRIERTPEGLRIQIVDQEQRAMFPSGSAVMYPHMRKLLAVVVKAVQKLPNRISIRGHTDARPFSAAAGYDNWRLSADRANATRKALIELGLPPQRIAEVVGKADTEPLIADDPYDARNRRITLVLLNTSHEKRGKAKPASESHHPPPSTADDTLGLTRP